MNLPYSFSAFRVLGLPVLEPLLVGLDPDLGEVLRGLKQKVPLFHP